MLSAQGALERLRQGNQRFAEGRGRFQARDGAARRAELLAGQAPFAVVLGCSDSRVPVEIVFDQGLGDLFVIRVAGNIVAPSHIGSVEFAAERFGSRLVVVLGHTRCGAVRATLEELERPAERQSPHLRSIVERIRPAVEGLLRTRERTADRTGSDAASESRDIVRPESADGRALDRGAVDRGPLGREELEREAVRANVRASVDHLRHGSEILERAIREDGLLVVGAEYSLETGLVEFLEEGATSG